LISADEGLIFKRPIERSQTLLKALDFAFSSGAELLQRYYQSLLSARSEVFAVFLVKMIKGVHDYKWQDTVHKHCVGPTFYETDCRLRTASAKQ
jgi:hypothetical protein